MLIKSNKNSINYKFEFILFSLMIFYIGWFIHNRLIVTIIVSSSLCTKLFFFKCYTVFNDRYTAVVKNVSYKKYFNKYMCCLWVMFTWFWPAILMIPTLYGDWSGLRSVSDILFLITQLMFYKLLQSSSFFILFQKLMKE